MGVVAITAGERVPERGDADECDAPFCPRSLVKFTIFGTGPRVLVRNRGPARREGAEARYVTIAAGGDVLRWAVASAENKPAPAPCRAAFGGPPIVMSCAKVHLQSQ
jgi:hypothetical protein